MIDRRARTVVAFGCAVTTLVAGCGFQGINSLPLPGAIGRGQGSTVYHVEIANVGTLESNSPVMIGDVTVGSVGRMRLSGWHADLEVSVRPGVAVPANAVASVGQTSLLGSMHLQLDPPIGQAPEGQLKPGSTIPADMTMTYPSTEQTLSSLAALVNGGGLGQVGDVVRNFNVALNGHEGQVRELIMRLSDVVGVLDQQREDVLASIDEANRVAAVIAGQSQVLDEALQRVPPALEVLTRERPRITAALDKLGSFSDNATGLINDIQVDLIKNLRNLGPIVKALADVGPELDAVLAYLTVFPYSQNLIDRGLRGDFMNLFAVLDFTVPRLKRTMFLGTRWGESRATFTPAPGDPWYLNYTYEPLSAPINPPPAALENGPLPATGTLPTPADSALTQMPPVDQPVLPIAPPQTWIGGADPAPRPLPSSSIFAGPYPPPASNAPPAAEGGH